MKAIKEPKTFKYPRLYLQLFKNSSTQTRLRILYPDGYAEYKTYHPDYNMVYTEDFLMTCYAYEHNTKTGDQVLKAMRLYDAYMEYMYAIYLGELK